MQVSADAKHDSGAAGYSKGRGRVDLQVFLLTALLVILSCGVVFGINYYLSYHSMVESLRLRADSIHQYTEQWLSSSSFIDLNARADDQTEPYRAAKEKLGNIRMAAGVRYLYTAKKKQRGRIYLLGGRSAFGQ